MAAQNGDIVGDGGSRGELKSWAGDQRPRVADPNPAGIFTALGLRNAIEGEGFLPGNPSGTPKSKGKK